MLDYYKYQFLRSARNVFFNTLCRTLSCHRHTNYSTNKKGNRNYGKLIVLFEITHLKVKTGSGYKEDNGKIKYGAIVGSTRTPAQRSKNVVSLA